MNFQVIYFSRKGSTKKIADAIASELGINAEDVKNAKLGDDTFVFLGSGCYGSKPSKLMTKFIEENDFKNNIVALFGTSGGGHGSEVYAMEDQLKTKQIEIKDKFFCRGKFFFIINRGKPNNEDLDKAKKFAKHLKI
jgi:flavodoxin I